MDKRNINKLVLALIIGLILVLFIYETIGFDFLPFLNRFGPLASKKNKDLEVLTQELDLILEENKTLPKNPVRTKILNGLLEMGFEMDIEEYRDYGSLGRSQVQAELTIRRNNINQVASLKVVAKIDDIAKYREDRNFLYLRAIHNLTGSNEETFEGAMEELEASGFANSFENFGLQDGQSLFISYNTYFNTLKLEIEFE